MVYTAGAPANPLGTQVVFDGENPLIFTGRAVANISGGTFVYVSGTNGALFSSGLDSFTDSDLLIAPAILSDQVNGIALDNVASGTSNYVAVARQGTFLVQCKDVVSGGATVTFSSGGIANVFSASAGSGTIPGVGQFNPVGRSMSAGDSAGFALLSLRL